MSKMIRLRWWWARSLYRRHRKIGHPDSHDRCEECDAYVAQLRKLDLASCSLVARRRS